MSANSVWRDTFVLQEVAHARATGQDQLGDVLDDLGLFLRRKGGEPFGEALRGQHVRGEGDGVCDTHDFALPRQQDHVPSGAISSVPVPVQTAVRRRRG